MCYTNGLSLILLALSPSFFSFFHFHFRCFFLPLSLSFCPSLSLFLPSCILFSWRTELCF